MNRNLHTSNLLNTGFSKLIMLLSIVFLMINVTVQAQVCTDKNIYAIPNGKGNGTRISPTNLVKAIEIYKKDTTRNKINLSIGTFDIYQTIKLPSGLTIEGAYEVDKGIWKKSFFAFTTIAVYPEFKQKKFLDIYGRKALVGHYIGLSLDSVKNITLRDFKLEVAGARGGNYNYTDNGDGATIYGIYSHSSEKILLLNIDIKTDDGNKGQRGWDGSYGYSANGARPGGRYFDEGATGGINDPIYKIIPNSSNAFRAGGTGGTGGRVQQNVPCVGPACLLSACAPESPAPKGESGNPSGFGSLAGGEGAVCGAACTMDCEFHYVLKNYALDQLKDFLTLNPEGLYNPIPQPGSKGNNGTNLINGTSFDQANVANNDLIGDPYYITSHGEKGGDASGGSGGGGGGAGGIRTLMLPPAIPGSADPYSQFAKFLEKTERILSASGVPICQSEVLNKSTAGGPGGAGGEGGGGGSGGGGGGGSFGFYACKSKDISTLNCTYQVGAAGVGGEGGQGGEGGNGSLGEVGRVTDGTYSYIGSIGGPGGNGGTGGKGQHGGIGRSSNTRGFTPSVTTRVFSHDMGTLCTNSIINLFKSHDLWTMYGGEPSFVKYSPPTSSVNSFDGTSNPLQVSASSVGSFDIGLSGGNLFLEKFSVPVTETRALPVIHNASILCAGDTLKLVADSSGGYLWKVYDKNNTLLHTSGKKSTSFVPPLENTKYYVSLQDFSGCCGWSIPVFKQITVTKRVNPVITTSYFKPYCYGTDSARLETSSGFENELFWSNGITTNTRGSYNFIFVKDSGSYTLKIKTDDGCYETTAPLYINIFSLPKGKPTVTGSNDACERYLVPLVPNPTPGMLFNFYQDAVGGNTLPDGAKVLSYIKNPTFKANVDTIAYYASYVSEKTGCVGPERTPITLRKETTPPVTAYGYQTHFYEYLDNLSCTKTFNHPIPKGYDHCSGNAVTLKKVAGPLDNKYKVGVTIDKYRYTDWNKNTVDFEITVEVNDTISPKLFCPGNKTISTDAGKCSAKQALGTPTVVENCNYNLSPAYIYGNYNGYDTSFLPGVSYIRYQATDSSGNVGTCIYTITVNDTVKPTPICPSDTTYYLGKNQCSEYVFYSTPVIVENCYPQLTELSLVSGLGYSATRPIGTSTEVWRAEDIHGNSNTCSFQITIADTVKPSITCISMQVRTDSGSDSALVNYALPIALDNCGGAATVSILSGTGTGKKFKIGEHTEVYKATDAYGNIATCEVGVTVSDYEAPVIICPKDTVINNDLNACGAVFTYSLAQSLDNDGQYYTPLKVLGLGSGTLFPVGKTMEYYRVTDALGNKASCAFTVTVKDTIAPVFTNCPSTTTIEAVPSLCGVILTNPRPVAIENSCSAITYGYSNATENHFKVGTNHRVIVAKDQYNNRATCEFDVIVTEGNTFAVVCPDNIIKSNDPGMCGAVVYFDKPTTIPVYDASCTQTTLVSGPAPGATFLAGISAVTYDVTIGGVLKTCSFNVTVNDIEFPKIKAPANIVQHISTGNCGANVTFVTPVGKDNCSNVITTRESGAASGSFFNLGTTVQKYITQDFPGNKDSCSFTITITDTVAPVIICPADIVVHTNQICGEVVNYTPPVGIDNSSCVTTLLVEGLASGSIFPVGITDVKYVVADLAGNVDTCGFNITVIADAALYPACQIDIVEPSSNGQTKVVNYDIPGRTNCPGVTVFQKEGKGSGATFHAGLTKEVYNIISASGDTATCSFNVIVAEMDAPFINCEPFINLMSDSGSCGASLFLKTPEVQDESGIVSIKNDYFKNDTIAFFPAGTNYVNWTAKDQSGNLGTCNTTVQVQPNVQSLNLLDGLHEACEGEAMELNPMMRGTGPFTYRWTYYDADSNLYKLASIDSLLNFDALKLSDQKHLDLFVSNPCQIGVYTVSVFVKVNPSPVTTISGLDTSYCMYDTAGVALSLSPAGGILNGVGLVGNKFYPSKAGLGTHTITYDYFDSTMACAGRAVHNVTVYDAPVVNAFIDSAYCITAANVILDPINSVYSGTGVTGSTFKPSTVAGGTYDITRTLTVNGCISSMIQKVKLNATIPDATILSNGPFCSSLYLVKLNTVDPNGAWSGKSFVTDSATGTTRFDVHNATIGFNKIIYTVSKDACTSKDSLELEVKSADYGFPFTLPTYCYNAGPVHLDTIGKRYFGPGIENNIFDPMVLDSSMISFYGVSTRNSIGCTDTVWRIHAVVKPEILNPLQGICSKGDSLLLQLDPVFTSVKWFDNSTSHNKWVTDSGFYKVELHDKYGCSTMDTIKVGYKSKQSVPFITGNHKLFKCFYESVVLKIDTTFMSYTWSTGENGKSITINIPGSYSVMAVDTNNCPQRDTATVQNYNPVAGNKITDKGASLEAIAALNYQWFKDGDLLPGATGRTLPVSVTGKYHVVLPDNNNCASSSDTVTVIITGMEMAGAGNEFTIYPNPGFGKYVFSMKNQPETNVEVVILNAIGEHIQTLNIGKGASNLNYTIDLETYSTGVYTAHIKYGRYSGFRKIVKME